jgi:hypothetical protein
MFAKAKSLLMLTAAIELFAAGCAPTFDSHIDAPPALDSAPIATHRTERIAALDPRPQLPDADQSPCPIGSGLAACFTREQDLVRQRRFRILHDDRDYCRDAYDRARERAGE